ncbi:hypothetical protein BC831DRAFT_504035 [Entophlyctis helioformis]|nr:hypothetical protein BC831DRAFT_504035 [Entophlyctis helioformis]
MPCVHSSRRWLLPGRSNLQSSSPRLTRVWTTGGHDGKRRAFGGVCDRWRWMVGNEQRQQQQDRQTGSSNSGRPAHGADGGCRSRRAPWRTVRRQRRQHPRLDTQRRQRRPAAANIGACCVECAEPPAAGIRDGGHQAEGELALTLHFVRPCEVFNMQLLQSSSRTQEIYMDGNYVQTSRADPISDDGDEGHGDLPETWFLSTLELDPVDRVPVSSCTIKLLSRMVPNQVYVASIVVAGRLVPVPGQPEPKPVSKATAAAPAVNQAGGTDQPSAQTIQALIQSLTLETVGGMPDQIQSLRAAIQAAVEAKPAGHQSAAAAAATTGALGSDAAVESLRTIERKVDDLAERLDSRMQRIEACMQYIVGMLAGSGQRQATGSMVVHFVLHEEILGFQDPSQAVDNELLLRDYDRAETERFLDDLVASLQEDPSLLLNPRTMDTCKSFIKYFDDLPLGLADKLVDIVASAFEETTNNIKKDLDDNAQYNFETNRVLSEMYVFLSACIVEKAEARWKAVRAGAPPKAPKAKGKQKSPLSASADDVWEWPPQRERIATRFEMLVALQLDRLILASSERDAVMGLICKSVSLMLEDVDVPKKEHTASAIIETLGTIATKYDSPTKTGGVQSRIHDYLREDHLADFVADLLNSLIVSHDNAPLSRLCSKRHFTDKDLKAAKITARLLVRFSEIRPKELIKSMACLQSQFDSEPLIRIAVGDIQSYTIRCAMIEAIGNLIHLHLVNDVSENAAKSLHSYYDILIQRFRDVNHYVRSKVLQVIARLSDQACSQVCRDVAFHCYEEDQGRLSRLYFETRKANLMEVIQNKYPAEIMEVLLAEMGMADKLDGSQEQDTQEAESSGNKKDNNDNDNGDEEETARVMDLDEAEAETAARSQADPAAVDPLQINDVELQRLRVLLKYYHDGLGFIEQIEHHAVPLLCDLLTSSVKSEAIEAMRFFVVAFRFEMESSWEGVAAWSTRSGTRTRRTTRPAASESTSFGATSLCFWIRQRDRGQSRKADVPVLKRQGALIVLGMIGKSRKEVLLQNIDRLARYGLVNINGGHAGQVNLSIARHTCMTLQHAAAAKREKGSLAQRFTRLPMNHAMFERLAFLILHPTKSVEWFGFCEQALNTIYALAEHPDVICGNLVKQLAARVFATSRDGPDSSNGDANAMAADTAAAMSTDADADGMDNLSDSMSARLQVQDGPATPPHDASVPSNTFKLAQLCFLVGHVAIKQIVHLEVMEAEWKRRRYVQEAANKIKDSAAATGKGGKAGQDSAAAAAGGSGDLEQVTGSIEDEFAERMLAVRERELLFSERSLLGRFGPLIAHICMHNRSFPDPLLQIMATLALCKFMCVSTQFCESHLPLLFAVLERSNDPIIRSNTIIGLGDMTISFNALIDPHISHLYNRLSDADPTVKKNTLMVLTFLILNGMVKVKGQIAEMAKCLEDPDVRISDLARLFFTELSTKDNAIYNNLPDMISNLSSSVDEDTYRSIMRFLFEFIKKEKQSENIIEKLCVRFRNADTERQWQDIAYCLSLLSFSTDKSFKKLVDHLPFYQDKLHAEKVYKYLTEIIKKVKKVPNKPDLKLAADEFEKVLEQLHATCVENHEAAMLAGADQRRHESGATGDGSGSGSGKSGRALLVSKIKKRAAPAERVKVEAEDQDGDADQDDEMDVDAGETQAEPQDNDEVSEQADEIITSTAATAFSSRERRGGQDRTAAMATPGSRGRPVKAVKAAKQSRKKRAVVEEDDDDDDDGESSSSPAKASKDSDSDDGDEDDNDDDEISDAHRIEETVPSSKGRSGGRKLRLSLDGASGLPGLGSGRGSKTRGAVGGLVTAAAAAASAGAGLRSSGRRGARRGAAAVSDDD